MKFNLTPKEKAKEIFDKMKGFRVKHSHSKKCAKIAIDEILKAIDWHDHEFPNELCNYYEEVKQEIDNL